MLSLRLAPLLAATVVMVLVPSAWAAPTRAPAALPSVEEVGQVIGVVSGDTIFVQIQQPAEAQRIAEVHYLGVDAPEWGRQAWPNECFGDVARDRNAQIVLGRQVRLVRGPVYSLSDGTLPRFVYLGEISVGEELVVEGAAVAVLHPFDPSFAGDPDLAPLPDSALDGTYTWDQAQARAAQRGLWGACNGVAGTMS